MLCPLPKFIIKFTTVVFQTKKASCNELLPVRRVAIIKYFDLEKRLASELHSNVLQRLIFCSVFYPSTIGVEESILFEGKSGNMLS